MNNLDYCPACKISLIGAPIPQKYRKYYSNSTHFKREIGIYDIEKDKVIAWKCPDCGYEWERK